MASKASKLRRKLIRQAVANQDRLKGFWKDDLPKTVTADGETVTVKYIAAEDERPRVMHKIGAGAQHRGLAGATYTKAMRAFLAGREGESFPLSLPDNRFYRGQYNSGKKEAAKFRSAMKEAKRLAELGVTLDEARSEQEAQMRALCKAHGVVYCEENVKLLAQRNQKDWHRAE